MWISLAILIFFFCLRVSWHNESHVCWVPLHSVISQTLLVSDWSWEDTLLWPSPELQVGGWPQSQRAASVSTTPVTHCWWDPGLRLRCGPRVPWTGRSLFGTLHTTPWQEQYAMHVGGHTLPLWVIWNPSGGISLYPSGILLFSLSL